MELPITVLILLTIPSFLKAENDTEATPQILEDPFICNFPPGMFDESRVITRNNFNNVYNATSASLVQFHYYNCTDCDLDCNRLYFTPWKHFTFAIHNWRDVVTTGQINCASHQNIKFCEEYEISEYPTFRYFPPLLKNFYVGRTVLRNYYDFFKFTFQIIEMLEKTETKHPNWPDLSPINSTNIDSIIQTNNGRLMILVVEKSGWYLGRELILDLYGLKTVDGEYRVDELTIKDVDVRYTFDEKLSNIKEPLPQVFAMKSNDSPKQLALTNTTRKAVFESVRDYLENEGYNIPSFTITEIEL